MTGTDKELYDTKISAVHQSIQANAEVQNVVNENILATLARIEAQTAKANDRVTSLEKSKWKLGGIIIGVSSLFSISITLFGIYLKFNP